MDVIDALTVTLGLDPSDFVAKSQTARADLAKTADAGRKAASETEDNVKRATAASTKHAKELDVWGKTAAEGLGKLRDAAIGLFAAFEGIKGASKLIIDTTQAEAATSRLAHNLSLPVQTLSQWQQVMRTVGGTADDANSSLQGMQGTLLNASLGHPDAMQAINILGINHNENASQAMITASKFFSTHDGAIDQQVAGMSGISTAMMNFLEQGPTKVAAALAAAAKTAITPKEAADSTALQKRWATFQNTLDGIGNELTDAINPGLQKFLGWLQQIADWGLKHPEQFGAAGSAAAALTGAAGAKVLRGLARSILGKGGPGAAGEAAEATEAAEIAAAGGSVVLSPLLAAALGVYASNALGEPGIDPNESAELRKLYPNAPKGTPATADQTLPPIAQTFLNSIGSGESKNNYSALYGGGQFGDFSQFPQWAGVQGPQGITHAAGRYQFEPGTYADASKALGLTDFSPASQDKAAWWLAQQNYRGKTGRDLLTDLRAHNPQTDALIQQSLGSTWTSLRSRSASEFANSLTDAPAKAAPKTPTAPANAGPSITGGQQRQSMRLAAEQQRLARLAAQITAKPSPAAAGAKHWTQLAPNGGLWYPPTSPAGAVNSHNTHSAETHVHIAAINTQAKDANGIAKSLTTAIKKNGVMLAHANSGLT
jgi:muramidase (phage lysozyme)